MKSAVGTYTPPGMWWQQADLSLLRFASTSLLSDHMATDLDINVFVPQHGKHKLSAGATQSRRHVLCFTLQFVSPIGIAQTHNSKLSVLPNYG